MVTRVLSVSGIEKAAPGKSFHGVDTNPSKGTMVAEFDVPGDAWFFQGSSSPDLMPYSILMEIGLQTSGILTSWVKAPLTMDRDNILFRNLDATAKLLRRVDLWVSLSLSLFSFCYMLCALCFSICMLILWSLIPPL